MTAGESPLIEASPIDMSAHRLMTSQAPRRAIDTEVQGWLQEPRPGWAEFAWSTRWPPSTGNVWSLHFLLYGVGRRHVRRLPRSLLSDGGHLHRHRFVVNSRRRYLQEQSRDIRGKSCRSDH